MFLLNTAICIILLVIGFNLKNLFKSISQTDRKFLNKLYWYHIVIAVFFHFYIIAAGGDATHYWYTVKEMNIEEVLVLCKQFNATGFIFLINYFPSNILDLSFFSGNLFYAIIGYLGFIYFYLITKSFLKDNENIRSLKFLGVPLITTIWFLPNLHFWSSGIGKDTILFFCISLFIYSIQKARKRLLGIAISLLLSFFIRPHVTMFLLISFSAGYVLDGNLKAYQKLGILLLFFIGIFFTYQFVLDFIQLESFETTSIEEFASKKASKLNKVGSGSGIDISAYPFPLKIATFLYRPFFFDSNGIMGVFASLENLILVLFTFSIFKNKPFKTFKTGNFITKGMVLFFILGTVSFSLILGNLGIMLRQKNMFIPLFLIFGILTIYNNTKIYEGTSNNK